MDCGEIQKLLSDTSGDRAPLDVRACIDEHLKQCQPCSEYAADLSKTIRALKEMDEIEPPAGLTRKVMAKIRTEAAPKKSWLATLFFPLHIKLPLEAFATLLITVAAIFVYKSMGPELQKMEVQPQAPVMKSLPAEPEKEQQKPNLQKQELQQPPRIQEETKHKDSAVRTEPRELMFQKEEKPVEHAATPVPVPSPAVRQFETDKARGLAARDEMMNRYAPAAPRLELSEEKETDSLATIKLTVKELNTARKEIETYLVRIRGKFKIIEQTESRTIITVALDPEKSAGFFEYLDSVGKIEKNRYALPAQISFFKLIIEKQ